MQCAAMSIPQLRSAPRGRATIGFVPIESMDDASSRPPPIGCSPAKAPNPAAPVDSTAARSRSTTPSAAASETPAAAYVLSPVTGRVYFGRRSPATGRSRLRPNLGHAPPRPRQSGGGRLDAAVSFLRAFPDAGLADGGSLAEDLALELGPTLRPAGREADDRVADRDLAVVRDHVEHLDQRVGLRRRVVGAQVQLAEGHLR